VFTVDNECIEQERDFEVLAATVFGGKISVYLPEDFVSHSRRYVIRKSGFSHMM